MKKTSKFLALVLSFLTTASIIGLAGAVRPGSSPEVSTEFSSKEIVEELKNISITSLYDSHKFTFKISQSEPITQKEIDDARSELQEEVDFMKDYFFSEDQDTFSPKLFKVLVLIYNLKDLCYENDRDLSRSFVTMFSSIVKPDKMPEKIKANSVKVSFRRERLEIKFLLNGLLTHRFITTVN